MSEKRTGLLMGAIALLTSIFTMVVYHFLAFPTIRYVQTDKLVYGYEGMKEYQAIYKNKVEQLKSNVDSLEKDFQHSVESYNNALGKFNETQKREQTQLLRQQEENLLKYKESIQLQMQKEDGEMTSKALEQISAFVQDYGKQKGYTLLLGTTNEGSILYASEKEDVTEELLKVLNEDYKGKSK